MMRLHRTLIVRWTRRYSAPGVPIEFHRKRAVMAYIAPEENPVLFLEIKKCLVILSTSQAAVCARHAAPLRPSLGQ